MNNPRQTCVCQLWCLYFHFWELFSFRNLAECVRWWHAGGVFYLVSSVALTWGHLEGWCSYKRTSAFFVANPVGLQYLPFGCWICSSWTKGVSASGCYKAVRWLLNITHSAELLYWKRQYLSNPISLWITCPFGCWERYILIFTRLACIVLVTGIKWDLKIVILFESTELWSRR